MKHDWTEVIIYTDYTDQQNGMCVQKLMNASDVIEWLKDIQDMCLGEAGADSTGG